MDAVEIRAGFFLTENQFLENRELVRSIYAAGHTIGLTVEEGEADIEAALKAANHAMDQVLFCKSVQVLLPEDMQLQGPYVRRVQRVYMLQTDENGLVHENAPFLYVCRGDVASVFTILRETETVTPQLLETTYLP